MDLGLNYIGPVDGHNIEELTRALAKSFCSRRDINCPCLYYKRKRLCPCGVESRFISWSFTFQYRDRKNRNIQVGKITLVYLEIA